MADPSIVDLTPMTLDKERHLLLTHAALRQIELDFYRIWGVKQSLYSVLASGDGLTMTDAAIMLWRGLQHEDATLTYDQVWAMLNPWHLPVYHNAIMAAWNAAWPLPAAQDESAQSSTDPLAFSPGTTTGAALVSTSA